MLFITVIALITALAALYRAWKDHYLYSERLKLLNQSVEQARKILDKKARLASEVAHEIKNPLTAILCSAETLDLLIGDKIESEQRQSLRYIKEYGDILLRLVSDFLDLTRVEHGQVQAKLESVEVLPAVRAVVGLLKTQALEKEISVRLLHGREEPLVLADARYLKQVLFNLVYNAIKYNHNGGTVDIIVTPEDPGKFMRISVQDDGPGISEAKLDKIFDLYQRFDSTYKNTEEVALGTGVGLSLCKHLVGMMGGEIWVDSEEGVGAKFNFNLPVFKAQVKEDAADEVEQADDQTEHPQPLLGLNFLIIDEDVGSRESVARLIQAWGGMVDRVSEAVEAINALDRKNYDAIMIDDELAASNSEITKTIKGKANDKRATVIIAGRQPENKELVKSGTDVYIEKPFNSKALLQSLINTHDQH